MANAGSHPGPWRRSKRNGTQPLERTIRYPSEDLTTQDWLQTPDGRKSWASYFLDQGYEVYIVDTAARGRSAPDSAQEYVHYPTGMVEQFWTATKTLAPWPQAKLHTQWPGVSIDPCDSQT